MSGKIDLAKRTLADNTAQSVVAYIAKFGGGEFSATNVSNWRKEKALEAYSSSSE